MNTERLEKYLKRDIRRAARRVNRLQIQKSFTNWYFLKLRRRLRHLL